MEPYYLKDGSVWYEAPMVSCKTAKRRRDEDECRSIPLPFPILRSLDEDRPDWPPDDWQRTIVCIDCANVSTYSCNEVRWELVRKSSPGQYRNDTNCFCVELLCAEKGCDIPVKFHVEMHDKKKADLEREIRKGFVGCWPICGHPALARPFAACKIDQVYLGPI